MAVPDPSDLEAVLQERQHAEKVVDSYGQLRAHYDEWQQDLQVMYDIWRGDFGVVWPDGDSTISKPKVLNTIEQAVNSRSRQVAAIAPTFIVTPPRPGDTAKGLADKQERIFRDWFWRSRIQGQKTQHWAQDSMLGGLAICRVWADWDKPKEERYPTFSRVHPLMAYPDPVFAEGPNIDSMVIHYESAVRDVQNRYKVDLIDFKQNPNVVADRCKVIEFMDDEWYMAIAIGLARYPNSQIKNVRQVLVRAQHGIGCTPCVIGTSTTPDGMYHGSQEGAMGILNYENRLRTLILDDAGNRVYDSPLTWNIENDDEYGPGVVYRAEGPDARFEYPNRPNASFTNMQLVQQLALDARAASILPPSSSGDPNESIISAAGISATQSPVVEDVRNIQLNIIGPMLEKAIEVGVEMEKSWKSDAKNIGSYPGAMAETYSYKDLQGAGKVALRYGPIPGIDPINTSVMALQQKGGGIISNRTAMELSPFVEDPQKEEKRMLEEALDGSLIAGLLAKAQQGLLDPATLAAIRKEADSDVPLHDIVAKYSVTAPAAPPVASSQTPGAAPQAPGIAGATGGSPAPGPGVPPGLPPMQQLLGLAPQTRSARRGA